MLLAARGERPRRAAARRAARVRDAGLVDAGRPGVVTYSRKVFIPLTRLCRDRCHYCTFATVPHRLPARVPRAATRCWRSPAQGAALGCKEALFTLGDRPEDRWPAAREWLDAHGYDSTLEYVRAMAIAVLEETGLLPHLNPGVHELGGAAAAEAGRAVDGDDAGDDVDAAVRPSPAGRTTARPDKEPAVRLRVLEDAGRVGVPFTTGILVGIGETRGERAESLFAIRARRARVRHVQESDRPELPGQARHGDARRPRTPRWRSSPPRSRSPGSCSARRCACRRRRTSSTRRVRRCCCAAGIDDWGGVSPVTPGPRQPRAARGPQIDDARRAIRRGRVPAARAAHRLPARTSLAGEPWIDPRLHAARRRAGRPDDGLAREDAVATGRPWQEPDGGLASRRAGTDLHTRRSTPTGRRDRPARRLRRRSTATGSR